MVAYTQDGLQQQDPTLSVDDASVTFVGKWNRLVSRTNWEKGGIICRWKEAIAEAGAPAHESSDEAWATRVGGISAAHVGRLRRVWQRFGDTHDQFEGLYWSHFLVAMDWNDAEMWLEGAAQSRWSVSQMRAQRWEALGAPDELKPRDEDVIEGDWDEDSPLVPMGDAPRLVGPSERNRLDVQDGPTYDDVDDDPQQLSSGEGLVPDADEPAKKLQPEPVRPFADLPELPDDLSEAFEQFKIAILAHRMGGWSETSCAHVVAALDALKALAMAPIEVDATTA